jgi:hydrogenase-4 membrane subunit HyfE
MNNKSTSSNTTHPLIKPSPVCQSLTKGVGVSVFESIPMNQNIASGVNRESIPVTYNGHVRIGGLVIINRLNKNK